MLRGVDSRIRLKIREKAEDTGFLRGSEKASLLPYQDFYQ
jgi:hypothetical protein